jgi:acetoacetate decarboxylase
MTEDNKRAGMLRMPVHFGPRTGPRAGPQGQQFECRNGPNVTSFAINFLTDPQQLEALLPDRFELAGEPVVTVYANYQTDIEWLAGRGYNLLGVRFPATFNGEQDRVTGQLLTVLWENLTDPIITGRDELGVPKVYCELPEPENHDNEFHLTASWLGYRFLDMRVSKLDALSEEQIVERQKVQTSAGDLHYKYIPKTGHWGEADVAYVTHIPTSTPNRVMHEQLVGEGTVEFHRTRWEDMPTQFNIVNVLHALEIREYRGASMSRWTGGKDLGDARILR